MSCQSHINAPQSRLQQHGELCICKNTVCLLQKRPKLKDFAKSGLKCVTHTCKHTHTYIDTQMCMSTCSRTQTQKQHVSLQDEYKRFIFRPLDPLLCSGFTERMTELPCPLLAFVWGAGLLLWPQAGSLCLSVGQCKDGV